ncbi:hypothetical protein [Winogradskyella sp. SM1960]|uniref:hypothetical protein n=1 Tax=Winogradskyella sp. SM1960 TaxID=2865955 RepID=UPI001CD781C9|nr:hypothetical protein [Winogradskyella sp. SM1960]
MKTIKKISNRIALILSLLLMVSCGLTGEEVARLAINEVSKSDDNLIIIEDQVELKKGDEIAFWSDMDYNYEGQISLKFKIEIIKNDEKLGVLEIDPTDKNITIGELKTSINGKTDWSFTGKNTELDIKEDGNYTFRGLLVASENSTLEINKAELVIKK